MITPEQNLLSEKSRRELLEIAGASIDYGLTHHKCLNLKAEEYTQELQAKRASFVTLMIANKLRGCIGHLEAQQALVSDVAENAYSAAFQDPRFPPLARSEKEKLSIHISVLTPAEPMEFESETDLIYKIRPGRDGLILIEGVRRGTFLPSVWDQLPDPHDFLHHLKMKAGLPSGYWSNTMQVERYETESFPKE
ncbi:MAG: AmmeMemoRadiSam system protein A [Candidatus Thiodiazotropha sp. 6PLUC2]